MTQKVAVIGAGAGGLAAAARLARAGFEVVVFERASVAGGKIRTLPAGSVAVDAGPTVFTMRWVFDTLFAESGERLDEHVALAPLTCLARHAWSASERLDLFADMDRSAAAIEAFAGSREAQGYRDFCRRASDVYEALERPFIRSTQPTPVSLALSNGPLGLAGFWRIQPFATLWQALGDHFRDERLRQLFGRYATYCGSSPFQCPATLMLVAHVEQQGVWTIEGGMARLAAALADLAIRNGASLRLGCDVSEIQIERGAVGAVRLASGERFACDAVVVNADANAVAAGLIGTAASDAVELTLPSARSLSAITWTMAARTSGFSLERHNVFFSRDYRAEFDDIAAGRPPREPTVYVCAQDRGERASAPDGAERLLVLVNAPATGDRKELSNSEIEQCQEKTLGVLMRCGLSVESVPETLTVTSPRDFARLFPATGGALYGQASHGWSASFTRPEARTRIPGLYLAGGSVHPGPGVPMAAISGWLAAECIMADRTSASKWSAVVMPGGMSTR